MNSQARIETHQALQALEDLDDCARMDVGISATGPYDLLRRYIQQQDRLALSHAAGQDGEQCRAGAGEPDAWLYEYEHDGESDHCLSRVRFLPSWVEAKRATEHPLYLRSLSRGVPEGFPGELDTLRAFAVEQHEAFDRYCTAIAAQRKEG